MSTAFFFFFLLVASSPDSASLCACARGDGGGKSTTTAGMKAVETDDLPLVLSIRVVFFSFSVAAGDPFLFLFPISFPSVPAFVVCRCWVVAVTRPLSSMDSKYVSLPLPAKTRTDTQTHTLIRQKCGESETKTSVSAGDG